MALPRARAEAKLSAVVGQHAFEMLGQAMMAIGQARGHAVQSHRILEKVGKTIGFDAMAMATTIPSRPRRPVRSRPRRCAWLPDEDHRGVSHRIFIIRGTP